MSEQIKPIRRYDIDEIKSAALACGNLDLDSAQEKRESGGGIVCPFCDGEGAVDAGNDYCNIDGDAIGVQFYGIGDGHVNAERYYRAVIPSAVLQLIDDHAETVQQLQRDLEIEKQRVVDLGVLCLESVPRESLEKQQGLYEMAVKGRADMREALRNERDKVQQLQQRNDRLLAALKDARDWIDKNNFGGCDTFALLEKIDAIIAAEGEKG